MIVIHYLVKFFEIALYMLISCFHLLGIHVKLVTNERYMFFFINKHLFASLSIVLISKCNIYEIPPL